MKHIATTAALQRLTLAGGLVAVAGLAGAFSPALRVGAQPPEANSQTSAGSATPEPQANVVTKSVSTRATITGNGTAGRIPKFTGASTIGNSALIQKSGNIGIGTSSPANKLTVIASSGSGVYGASTGTNGNGVVGEANNGTAAYGVWGKSSGGRGVNGSSSTGQGVNGISSSGVGVFGTSSSSDGVASQSGGSGKSGVYGFNSHSAGYGVFGRNTANGNYGYLGGARGVYGHSSGTAVRGESSGGSLSSTGVSGTAAIGTGVSGYCGSGIGVYGASNSGTGIYGKSVSGKAGYFTGNVQITGNLTKGSGSFKIDHPLDPGHKYLSHSFVESPDMMNIYNGNAATDAKGFAIVTLPDYFTALNRDYRYQLTCIGVFAQAIVSSEIKDNRFTIRTDKPNVKVSWQVTGIRRDVYARDHRIRVEEDKGKERGYYLYPAGFGQPKTKGIEYARHPNLMKQRKERLARQLTLQK